MDIKGLLVIFLFLFFFSYDESVDSQKKVSALKK